MVDGRFLFLLTCICINCRFGDHQCSFVACEERLRVAHVAPATTNVPCGLWGTPSGGPRRSGDHQCSIWPVRSAFGWSVLHLRSLKGAVSTEGKHPWCTGKSAHLWEQMSPRFYVMMKALCIQCDYELSLVFLSASCWRIDVFTWRIFQSVRAERPSFSFGGSDVYTTFVTCRYAHNAFLSSSQTMSV